MVELDRYLETEDFLGVMTAADLSLHFGQTTSPETCLIFMLPLDLLDDI